MSHTIHIFIIFTNDNTPYDNVDYIDTIFCHDNYYFIPNLYKDRRIIKCFDDSLFQKYKELIINEYNNRNYHCSFSGDFYYMEVKLSISEEEYFYIVLNKNEI